MCGIVGIVSRPATRPPASPDVVVQLLSRAADAGELAAATEALAEVNQLLSGAAGVQTLVDRLELQATVVHHLDQFDARADQLDLELEAGGLPAEELERRSAELVRLRDVLWALRHDRLRTARTVADFAGRDAGPASIAAYLTIQQALSSIDRLEVRGRDSAGVHVFVWGHGLDLTDGALAAQVAARGSDPSFQSGGVRLADGVLSFVYKAAAEIGELGDNTRALRAAIAADDLLRRAVASPEAQVSVLAHTRWASVGIISEPNAHPVNSEEMEQSPTAPPAPYVVAALNGDVDNHADLRVEHQLRIHGQITTDAKVIPALIARHASQGVDEVEAFRRTVSAFEGSVAIAAVSARHPGRMLVALKGSGQGMYIGRADDRWIAASEPYGVVEETPDYLRLDGEHGGEIVILDGPALTVERLRYDGHSAPVGASEWIAAPITTRDIDRGDAPHFLLKEIGEAPRSFTKTLRGRIVERDGRLTADVGERALPSSVVARLAAGTITKVRVIGQGTAAVAGQAVAALLNEMCADALDIDAIVATELSGFGLRLDMSDTLAIAVSQSGTTTDTNTTVDLLRARGAAVIGIVNRRGSDLADKADGVLFTSDGRDIEMSVASTKAFYAQVAAGALLACAISAAAGVGSDARRHSLLQGLQRLPEAMRAVLARRTEIGEAARRFAPTKRYWSVLGNGPNKVAAEEVRIKLSELCYKSISADVTEDKKHIDLSSEPLLFVCAAGLQGSTADDVAKETAIFRAHKATPIVVADEGETRFSAAATITVPPVDPALGFVLSAMAGHLFGYEAALAIDGSARPLRAIREAVEQAVRSEPDADGVLAAVREAVPPLARSFYDGLRDQYYDGHLEASTAVRLTAILMAVQSPSPVETYAATSGAVGTPTAVVDELVAALTRSIEELTRPIDAIKHQAKTVTVGISRSDEGVLDRALVQATLAAGPGRDVLSYRTLKVLAALDPAVAEVVGFTRYRVDGDTITIVDRGGIARDIPSRVEQDSRLLGTKRHVATSQELLVARGRGDGRTVIFVPEVKAGTCSGITLLHVRFAERLPAEVMRGVLQGYDHRYDRLVDWVTETEGEFDETPLGDLPVDVALIDPISDTADGWRS